MIRICCSFLISALFTTMSLAKDLPSDAPIKTTINKVQSKFSEAHMPYYGSSGINPFNYSSYESDEVFIADRGWDLDKYLFKDSGDYEFVLEIDRFFGETSTGQLS